MSPKDFYKNYLADNNLRELNYKLIELIIQQSPNSIFEFGCGTGKNLRQFRETKIVTCGLDISAQNITSAYYKNELPFLIIGDETNLGHLGSFDIVFTCSVLDHIENIDRIISEFKRMCKTIFLAETNSEAGEFYYPHDYEKYGFTKLDFEWIGEDKAIYNIWTNSPMKNG